MAAYASGGLTKSYRDFPLSSVAGALGTAALVPSLFPVALAGEPFLIDRTQGAGLALASAARIRQQADQSQRPGETSLNPEGDWRRSFRDWRSGAGQDVADGEDSLYNRFRTSKGVDVWTEGQVTLLNDTSEARSSTNTNLHMAVAGSRLYVGDGNSLLYTTDLSSFTASTGTPASDVVSLTSAGHHIFAAFGSNGIYHTENDGAAAAQWVTGTVTNVWYVKGRVLCSNGEILYNPTYDWTSTANALPTALFTHPNDEWTWVDAAEGLGNIYVGGYAGDRSEIYRTEVQPSGSSLTVPVVAGRLPEGETITALDSYLSDFILIGTNKGVRVASQDSTGDLLLGPLIETGQTVRDFEGQGEFVWFTWENYDGSSSGLGRLDLTQFTQRGAPAYASDLMTSGNASVQSVVTFGGKRVFSVNGDGFYEEDTTTLVPSGTLTTGSVTFGLTEETLAKSATVTHDLSYGSITVAEGDDGSTWNGLGTTTIGTTTNLEIDEHTSDSHELQVTLTRDATSTGEGPVLRGLSLRAHPHADSTVFWTARLQLNDIEQISNGWYTHDVVSLIDSIQALHDVQSIVSWQVGTVGYSVTVEDFEFTGLNLNAVQGFWSGILSVRLKVI